MVKSYLKKVFSIVSLACITLSTASAKHFTTNNMEFMEVVSVEKSSFNPKKSPIDVVICQFKSDNELPPKIDNDFFYNNKKYSIKNLKILENKFEIDGLTYLEVQDLDTLLMKRLSTDVILYDIKFLSNATSNVSFGERNTLVIPKYFKYNDKLYRVKAINKDIVDECYKRNIKIKTIQHEQNVEPFLKVLNKFYDLYDMFK